MNIQVYFSYLSYTGNGTLTFIRSMSVPVREEVDPLNRVLQNLVNLACSSVRLFVVVCLPRHEDI